MSKLAGDYWDKVEDTNRHKQWLSSIYQDEIGRSAVFDDVGASYWVNQLESDIAGGATEENARERALAGIRGSDEVMFRGDVDQLVGRARNQQIGDVSALDKFLGSERNTFGLTAESSAEDWRDAFVGRDTSGIYDVTPGIKKVLVVNKILRIYY